jgi:dienelactone hydrolase
VLTFVDRTRRVPVSEGVSGLRALVTYVRYPALAPHGGNDVRGAALRPAGAPYPLLVFGHGFAVTPGTYTSLLRSWARAGFVVAAPAFPLENAHAPGGPNEADLPNQPADMSFVISSMLALSASPSNPLKHSIDPRQVAVAGQSDGGDTALATAYDPAHRDPRVGAAVILSGAEIPGHEGFGFPAAGPPLLAVQGTADTVNPPALTDAFFGPAPRPKFELQLPGAEHLPPYTSQQPQLSIVERVSADFLDAFLLHRPGALARMARASAVPGAARLIARP